MTELISTLAFPVWQAGMEPVQRGVSVISSGERWERRRRRGRGEEEEEEKEEKEKGERKKEEKGDGK